METVTRKNLRFDFEIISCEVTARAAQQAHIKACVKRKEKIQDVEFFLESDEVQIGNEKKIYEKIDSYLKSMPKEEAIS